MKIRFTTDVTDLRGAHESGSVVECSEDVARDYIYRRLAEAVEEAPEAAALLDAPERATHHRGRGR